MTAILLPATQDIREVVEKETVRVGGTVLDCFDDGDRLFLRAVLPVVRHVRAGDRVQAGIAVMTTNEEILVHPYTFREVCRNGAIRAEAIQTRHVHRVEFSAPTSAVDDVIGELREAFQACSAPESFSTVIRQMRSAMERKVDSVIELVAFFSTHSSLHPVNRIVAEILGRFMGQPDRSLFGLMNAVTSVARDEPDPETRWRLEELGGTIPTIVPPAPTPTPVTRHLVPV